MFDLVYNIDFEVVALLFTMLLYFEIRLCYPMQSRKNRIFRFMTLLTILTELFDLASAFTNTYTQTTPLSVNILINSGYFMSGLLLCFMLHYYIEHAFLSLKADSILLKINKWILLAVEIMVVLNFFFGFFFYFSSEGVYSHGPLYLLMHLTSLWFVLCASIELISRRKTLKSTQFLSGVLFLLLYVISVILQTFVFPQILLIMPASSAMLAIALFTLETPDYVQLQRTLEELTATKQELETANKKYYHLAYTDAMTDLMNKAAFNKQLEQLKSENRTVILLVADINNLKYLNDHFGHLTGDEVITKTAKLLKQNFTDGCWCYRIGGDEFAVIGHTISPAAFEERHQHFIRDMELENSASDYLFSVASAYQIADSAALSDAFQQADEKMYQNKQKLKQKNP